MNRYYFEGWIDMIDYGKYSKEDLESNLQSDISDVLEVIVEGKYSVNITKSEVIKEEN